MTPTEIARRSDALYYDNGQTNHRRNLCDRIAYLEARLDPIKPVIVSDGETGHCECGACGKAIDPWDAFCRHCGQAVDGGRWASSTPRLKPGA